MTDFELDSLRILSDASESRGSDSETTIRLDDYGRYSQAPQLEFEEGTDVLTHWSDGLFYLGVIVKVNADCNKCLVKFEDKSHFWCSFHHLQKAAMPGADIVCSLCREGRSVIPNEIVLCDNCNQGYHQKCHKPKISNKVLRPDAPWLCRKCVFATTARTGGAIKKGTAAQTLLAMKRSLPYNPKSLTWDVYHRTNKEDCYCYCGGPGIWYKKMLKCSRCFQWFHEACLQCLDYPLLSGDNLYIFVCCLCNSGHEFLNRLELTWLDIAHLVLFNLALQNRKKFFDLDSEVLPFLNTHWTMFQLKGQIARISEDVRRAELFKTLENHTERFKNGSEIKKRMQCYSLRIRLPPPTPDIQIPMRGQLTHSIVEKLVSREFREFNGSSRNNNQRFIKGNASVSEPGSSTSSTSSSQTEFYSSTKSKSNHGSDSEDASSIGTLDSIIPPPTNFEGANHPFWNMDIPRNPKRKKRQLTNLCDFATHCRSQQQHCKNKGAKRMNVGSGTSMDTGSDCESLLLEKRIVSPVSSSKMQISDLKSTVNSFFSGTNRIAGGEKFNVLARRITSDGAVQHLIEWEGSQ